MTGRARHYRALAHVEVFRDIDYTGYRGAQGAPGARRVDAPALGVVTSISLKGGDRYSGWSEIASTLRPARRA